MSTTSYSRGERGGGSGETGRMRAAILNQINSWWLQAKWSDPDRADRIHEKLNEAPEEFISPNPSTDYREEASRIYGEIKDEYGLRSVTDLEDEYQDYQERADRHYRDRSEPKPEKVDITPDSDPADIDRQLAIDEPNPEPESDGWKDPSDMWVGELLLRVFLDPIIIALKNPPSHTATESHDEKPNDDRQKTFESYQ